MCQPLSVPYRSIRKWFVFSQGHPCLKQSGSERNFCTLQPWVSLSKAVCALAVAGWAGTASALAQILGSSNRTGYVQWLQGIFLLLINWDFIFLRFFWHCWYFPFYGSDAAVPSLSICKRRLNVLLLELIFFTIHHTSVTDARVVTVSALLCKHITVISFPIPPTSSSFQSLWEMPGKAKTSQVHLNLVSTKIFLLTQGEDPLEAVAEMEPSVCFPTGWLCWSNVCMWCSSTRC